MRHLPIVSISLLIGFITGCAEAKHSLPKNQFELPKNGYPILVESSGSEQVDTLVSKLVSKRPAPFPSNYWPVPSAMAFIDRYSTPEVELAFKRLKDLGPTIFPQLIEHIGDDRYSYSTVVEAWVNCTVGAAVVEILDDGYEMHGGYKWRHTASGSDGYLSFRDYLDSRGTTAWAEWAKTRSRLQIQIDFIDWCIEKENQRGYTDDAQKKQILESYESRRQQMIEEYSQKR